MIELTRTASYLDVSEGPDSAPSRHSFPLSRLCTVTPPLEEDDPAAPGAAAAGPPALVRSGAENFDAAGAKSPPLPPLLAVARWAVGDDWEGRLVEAGTMTSSKTIRCWEIRGEGGRRDAMSEGEEAP